MTRSSDELRQILQCLIDNWENEVVEFKAVGDSHSTSDIGKYVSALSNEANLRSVETAYSRSDVNRQFIVCRLTASLAGCLAQKVVVMDSDRSQIGQLNSVQF